MTDRLLEAGRGSGLEMGVEKLRVDKFKPFIPYAKYDK